MTDLFRATFEKGDFSDFPQTSVINGQLAMVTPGYVGNYAGKFDTVPTLQAAQAIGIVQADAPEVYQAAMVYIAKGPSQMVANDRFYVFQCYASNGGILFNAGLRRENLDPLKWVLWFGGTHHYGTTIVDPAAVIGWHWIVVHYNKATGVCTLTVDGKLEVTITVDATALPNAHTYQFGIVKTGATGTTFDPTGQYAIQILEDECSVSDTPPTKPTPGGGQPPTCASHLTQAECTAAGCYWVNGACQATPPTTGCATHTTEAECVAADCYWVNGACQSTPGTTPPTTPLLPKVRSTLIQYPFFKTIYAKIDQLRTKTPAA